MTPIKREIFSNLPIGTKYRSGGNTMLWTKVSENAAQPSNNNDLFYVESDRLCSVYELPKGQLELF